MLKTNDWDCMNILERQWESLLLITLVSLIMLGSELVELTIIHNYVCTLLWIEAVFLCVVASLLYDCNNYINAIVNKS